MIDPSLHIGQASFLRTPERTEGSTMNRRERRTLAAMGRKQAGGRAQWLAAVTGQQDTFKAAIAKRQARDAAVIASMRRDQHLLGQPVT
jgi:hypothetical protein